MKTITRALSASHGVFLPFFILSVIVFCVTARAAVSIETKILAPDNAAAYYVSPRGVHVAAVVMRGSRQVVTVDGVEGPRFDRIVPHGGDQDSLTQAVSVGGARVKSGMVVFSQDGTRHAYAAISGNDLVVMLDGREIYRAANHMYALGGMARIGLTFSPKGKNLYFIASTNQAEPGLQSVIMNGKVGPSFAYQTTPGVIFSADDMRHVYSTIKAKTRDQVLLVVDGKEAAYAGVEPQFTADGKKILTISRSPQGDSLLVDGKSVLTAKQIMRVVAAPTGNGYGAIVRKGDRQADTTLFLGEREITGTESVRQVYFSPDAKRWAAWCDSGGIGGPQWMVIEGKRGGNFQSIDGDPVGWKPSFTSDGRKFVYVAFNAGRRFVVIGDEESDGFDLPRVELSDKGGRFAYYEQKTVVIDGRKIDTEKVGATRGILPDSFAFTSDGARFAFVASPMAMKPILVVDGSAVENFQPALMRISANPKAAQSYFKFSPNGNRWVSFGEEPRSRERALYIDGKVAYAFAKGVFQPDRMDFTADGNRLFWRGVARQSEKERPSYVVVENGQECLFYDRDKPLSQALQSTPGSWEMGADDKLRILAVTPEGVVRHTLTP